MFTRISKHEARKLFAEGKPFVLCPVNLRPGFPWAPHFTVHPAIIAEIKQDAESYRNNPSLWKGSVDRTGWDLLYNNWAHYNTSHEAGYYAAYYREEVQ